MRYLIISLLLISASCTSKNCVTKTSKIISVGGCDYAGTCGAMLEDAHIIHLYYPVAGQEVHYEQCGNR